MPAVGAGAAAPALALEMAPALALPGAGDAGDAGEREDGEDVFAFDVDDDEDPFCRLVALVGEELLLEFEAAKSALGQAKERAQLAVTTLLSAARPAQDALLRLEALAAEGPWPTAAWAIGLKRKAADREEAELNDLHQAEIALARANVVKCHIAVSLKHKAVLAEISEQRAELEAELEATAATDRRIAAMVRPD